MTHYFLDSSALVKRHITETGTAWVRSITVRSSGNTIITAQITKVEVVSGAMRRVRAGLISSRTAHATRLLVHRHIDRECMVIHFSEDIIERAQDLLETHTLRAYDSVQLASALEANQHVINAGLPPLIFVSADNQLLNAATAEGFAVDNPNLHPR